MKSKLLGFLIFGLALAGPPQIAHADKEPGGRDSGGSDVRALDQGTAWFLGAGKRVRTCIVRSEEFASVDAEGNLLSAFATWKKYVDARAHEFHAPFTLALDPELMPTCDGTEDLKVYLGAQTPEVAAALTRYNGPVAIAERTSYSLARGWGKGFIWIAGSSANVQWEKPYALLGVLLHELGHVLGCGHVAGTIMTEDFAAEVQRVNSDYTAEESRIHLASIDIQSQLATCSICGTRNGYRGKVPDGYDYKGSDTFRLFAGRDPVGEVRAEVPIFNRVGLPPANAIYQDLLLKDSKGTVRVPMHLSPASSAPESKGSYWEIAAFKMAIATQVAPDGKMVSGRGGGGFIPGAHVYFGSARDSKGATHDLVIEVNNRAPLQIRYYTGYMDRDLFVADPYPLQE